MISRSKRPSAKTSVARRSAKRRTDERDVLRRKTKKALRSVREEHRENQDSFLTQAGDMLSSSLDYKKTLANIAGLVVPRMAEWCAIEILHDDDTIEEVALAHADPKMIKYALHYRKQWPSDPNAPGGVRQVLRTGEPLFIPLISEDMLQQGAKSPEHLAAMKKLRMGGAIVMPLIARGRPLGVITLISPRDKAYTEADLAFCKRLASRAAMAVDNARLYEIQAHYGSLVENSGDAIISKRLDGTITSWNRAAEKLYGYTAQEVIGKNIGILSMEPDAHEIPELLQRLKSGEPLDHHETHRKTKDGRILHVFLTISPIKDAMGKVVGASAISRDITELVKAREEVLRLNRELEQRVIERTDELQEALTRDRLNLHRLKAMLSHLPFGALMMDDQGRIIELNEQYCRFFSIGLSAAEAMAISTDELNQRFQRSLENPEEHMKKVQKTITDKQTTLGLDIRLKNGRIIQRDYLAIHEEGKFAGQLFLYRDVTRERRIDAAKSEFMSLASHQLRTPLTGVRWAFGRLAKSLDDKIGDAERQMLRDGRRSSARMAQTIDTMLQIARLQSGDMTTDRSRVMLLPVLEEILESYAERIALRKHTMSMVCPPELHVRTDERLLREIVSNLISNAIKYTPDNGQIRLTVGQQDETVVLRLEDSGYGIPAHQQPKVFQKFFRGDNVISRETDGTGLGLYLVWLLTDLLGGTIRFESEEGRGTVFTLTLPATPR